MKLNYKRTILVGFAFFLISAFWQAYDNIIPMTLTNKFGMSQTWSGVIMTMDNILALFMLPLFGAISDKCRSPMGRRKPFILVGTIVACVAVLGLTFMDNQQLHNIEKVRVVDNPQALVEIYNTQADKTLRDQDGKEFVLRELFTQEEFAQIRSNETEDLQGETAKMNRYTKYVVPARQAYAWDATTQNPGTLAWFIALLLVILIAMAVFRSPAVALMPDVTIKPLRSKGNAVINLMGAAGGILVLVLGIVMATGSVRNSMMSYTVYFCIIAGLMLAALAVVAFAVKERRWVQEMEQESARLGIRDESEDGNAGDRKLTSPERCSLIFILLSVALWYFGYNAVTSKYSVYASTILEKDYNTTLIIAQAAAIVSYLPVGMIASKVGRKKTILVGVALLSVSFFLAATMRADSPMILLNILFALAGIGWATINVNSFPMVVELCSGGDVGKYTGFYYTASMAAQSLTPTISGALMDRYGMTVLFPYATVFVALAFVTMLFVKHGDSVVPVKRGLEAFDLDD